MYSRNPRCSIYDNNNPMFDIDLLLTIMVIGYFRIIIAILQLRSKIHLDYSARLVAPKL